MNAQIIKDFIDENGLTNSDFCRLCGIGYDVLRKVLDGGWIRSIEMACRVADVIGCTLDELVGRASIKSFVLGVG